MILEKIAVGAYAANCFIVGDEETRIGMVIDPGGEAERIYKKIEDLGLSIAYIVLTHAHGDHIGGVEKLKKLTSAPVLLHHDEEEMLKTPSLNLTQSMNGPTVAMTADRTIGEGEVLSVGGLKCKVIHTPGHTIGGICLYFDKEKILFSGDTLFYGSIGRTDLPGGSHKQLIQGILNKLMILEDQVAVYPGHGASSSIGFERKRNPFLQG
ncbi:MAG: MBL fold metallo-hydrolase [Clostridiales bacterium 38-18]|nr:MAG: MBL fold metallo-hydrolase [Clostridiales bacterium 38-18]